MRFVKAVTVPMLIGFGVAIVLGVAFFIGRSVGYEKACEAHGWQPLTSRDGGMCVDSHGYVRTP